MTVRRPSTRLFLLVLAAIVAYEVWVVGFKTAGATEHVPAKDVHLTQEVAGPQPLTQTFVVHADELSGVELFPRASAQPPAGPVVLTLFEYQPDGSTVRVAQRTVAASDLLASASFIARFPRIDRSAGRAYRLEIALPEAPAGHGLRFVAGGPTYPQGEMRVGERREWGDLQFRTVAGRTTFLANLQRTRRTAPSIFGATWTWIALALVFTWALAAIVYDFGLASGAWPPDAPPRTPSR